MHPECVTNHSISNFSQGHWGYGHRRHRKGPLSTVGTEISYSRQAAFWERYPLVHRRKDLCRWKPSKSLKDCVPFLRDTVLWWTIRHLTHTPSSGVLSGRPGRPELSMDHLSYPGYCVEMALGTGVNPSSGSDAPSFLTDAEWFGSEFDLVI